MNQIKRKRRLTAIEAAVLGNILYLIIVIIFKSVFSMVGRTSGFNYLFNGIELGVVGLFWIILFGRNFKNIYAGEKPNYLKYIFFMLMPIIILTAALTLVSLLWPGQDTNSIWNQFTFLAAPTIFWYLPYGLIYQLIGSYVSIFAFFGIALGVTILFQILGIISGRRMGQKYHDETLVEAEAAEAAAEKRSVSKSRKVKKRWDGKGKKPQKVSIGMERLSEEKISEGFRPEKQESVMMTGVMIEDATRPEETVISKNFNQETANSESCTNNETINQENELERVELNSIKKTTFENQPTAEATENSANQEKTEEAMTLEKTVSAEWKVTHPDDQKKQEKIEEQQNRPNKTGDKSFLKETSQIRIINEDDIEEYYRNKK